MRNSLRCPKCSCRTILHITQVADVLGDWTDHEPTESLHRPAARPAQSVAWRIARPPAIGPGAAETVGIVQAFVCRACGYTELFTTEPEKIPVDGLLVRKLDAEGGGPFRG